MAFTTISQIQLADPVSGTQIFNSPGQAVTAGAGNGIEVVNDGQTFLLIMNKGAAGTLSLITMGTWRGLAIADIGSITLPASGTNDGMSIFGPFDTLTCNDPVTSKIRVELTTGAGGADFWAYRLP
jgi:hypothetical protein